LVAKCSLAAADGIDLQLARGSMLPRLDGAVSVDVVAVLAAMVDHALASMADSAGDAWLEVSVQFGGNAVHLAVRDSGRAAAAEAVNRNGAHRAGRAFSTMALEEDIGDRLRMAQIICTRRGGHVGWAQGDHPVLEAWLPAGSGAP
jgi:sensor histidine kinase regulating citrate/malate metabolism